MQRANRRALAMLLVLLAAQLGAWAMRPTGARPASIAVHKIPLRLGGWSGRDLGPLDRMTLDMLQPDDHVNRVYTDADGMTAQLAVIFGHRKTTFHSPGFCLLGGGWNIVAKSRVAFRSAGGQAVEVNRFLLTREGRQAVVLYYYLEGGRSSTSWVKHQSYLVWDRMRGRPPAGALVRLTLPVGLDAAAATRRGILLLRLLHPHVAAAMAPRVDT